MHRNLRTPLLAGAALMTAASAQAQVTITTLVQEGDVLSLGTVTSISNVDVNNSGSWLVELDTDAASTMDNAILKDGVILHSERTSLGIPAPQDAIWQYDGFIDSMDINDNGDTLILMPVEDQVAPSSATDSRLVIWTNGSTGISYVLMEELVTPNTADPDQTMSPLWDSIGEVWQNNSNQLIVAGRSNTDADDMIVRIDHDGAGNITGQTLMAIDNVIHNVQFPSATGTHADTVQGFFTSKQNLAFNDAGQTLFFVDDQSFGPGGTPDYTQVDSHYYLDNVEVLWENQFGPNGMDLFGSLTSTEVSLNENGDWIAVVDTDESNTAMDFYIIRGDSSGNFVALQREGTEPPHLSGSGFVFTSTFSNAQVHLTDSGDYFWYGDWDDPDTTIDTGIFRNDSLLIQEGVSTIGGAVIDTISTSSDGRAYSRNGRYIIAEFTLVGGIEGAYLLDTASLSFDSYCFGDGGTSPGCTDCPCGNNATAGSGGGCLNSAGRSSILEGSGVPAVGSDTLRFEVQGAASSTFGILQSADNQLPQMGPCAVGSGILSPVLDGLRCVGGNALRHGTRATDANGDIGVTNNGWGPPNGPPGGLIAANGFMSGQTRNFQCFYREDALLGCQTGQNTTNAVSVTFQ